MKTETKDTNETEVNPTRADLLAENERLRGELTDLIRLLKRNRIRYSSGRMMPEVEQQIYIDNATAALNPLKP